MPESLQNVHLPWDQKILLNDEVDILEFLDKLTSHLETIVLLQGQGFFFSRSCRKVQGHQCDALTTCFVKIKTTTRGC